MIAQPALPYLWMLLSSLAFALMGTCTHALRGRCDWQVIALGRAALQLLFALALVRAAGVRLRILRPCLLWVRSIAGSIALVCMFYSYTRMPVSDVLTLANTFPIWVALLSWPLLRRPPAPAVWLAAASGICGVYLIQRPHFANRGLAAALALASSLFTAVAMIALNRLRAIDPRAIIVHFSAVALLFCIASLFLFERDFAFDDIGDAPTLLLLLGVGTAALVGQLFLTKAFADGDAARVSIVGLTQFVFALVFDVLVFDHAVSGLTLLGMMLVLAPTAWVMTSR